MNELLRRGIELFNRQEFFACHEVLEELWTPERGPDRLFLQSVIHIAVACYHCQRGNPRGAEGQFAKGLRKLAAYLPVNQGIDTRRLYLEAQAVLELVQARTALAGFPKIHRAGGQAFANGGKG